MTDATKKSESIKSSVAIAKHSDQMDLWGPVNKLTFTRSTNFSERLEKASLNIEQSPLQECAYGLGTRSWPSYVELSDKLGIGELSRSQRRSCQRRSSNISVPPTRGSKRKADGWIPIET